MYIAFTEKQEEWCQFVRQFAKTSVTPWVEKMENGIFPRPLLLEMGKLGLMGWTVPKKYGGTEVDFVSYISAIEELSKVSPALGVIYAVHISVGTNPILYWGTENQKERYVPKLASGEFLGAFALTEPNAGSDAASLKTAATKVKGGYTLQGTKVFITNGMEADTYIVFASTDRTRGAKGITAFIVEKETEGLLFGRDEQKLGLHGSRTVELRFENMFISDAAVLGNVNEGYRIALGNLNVGRIGIAAQAVGIIKGAMAAYYDYEVIGKETAFFSNTEWVFRYSQLMREAEAASLLTYQAASLKQLGKACTKQASMAKLFTSQTAVRSTTELLQLAGIKGLHEQYPVSRFFRDAKVTTIYEGTSEIQRIVIARNL